MHRVFPLASLFLLLSTNNSHAKEGMWLPPTLSSRAADLRNSGLQIPVDALYNNEGTGLNNAVVLFGKGCTGEMISPQGLVLTNHHCGYGTVQGLSTAAKDYFANGFWAMNRSQEIPCPGLTVTFVRKMENVTAKVLVDVADTLGDDARDSIIAVRVRGLEKGYRYAYPGLEASIKPYYNGNQYWVSVTETFRDVRLVGFPPNGIGQFGGDTDNWMWPRHTGDFSMFRVYSGKDNKPADYATGNIPYKPKKYFTINAKGYKEGDFTMVYGFPGTTQEYLAASQIDQVANIVDPVRIEVRTARLAAWTKRMTADRNVFLQYTSKRAGVANGWKKWQGELQGLKEANVVSHRRDRESQYQSWAAADETLPYADAVLSRIQANTAASDSALKAELYFQEAVMGIELLSRGAVLDRIMTALKGSGDAKALATAAGDWEGFYKNYDPETDRQVFDTLMPLFVRRAPGYVPLVFRQQLIRHDGDYSSWSRYLYANSIAADRERFATFLKSATRADMARLQADPVLQLYRSVQEARRTRIAPVLAQSQDRLETLSRLYMKAQMQADTLRTFYPDANLTLRLAYGQIKGIDPQGPAGYSYQTNLDEAIAKNNPNVAEFAVPEKLKTLYAKKDYGRWKVGNSVPIAFIADNHTTGGNSGSPVLNARGELIGTNFDRIWEGTMSDLQFDPTRSRNISLDVRYTLFIIEKFGGAGWLLNEMNIIR
jgi:hypothetical protein